MLDRVQLKLEAKAITKNARVSAYLFTLLYLVIVMVLQGLDALVSGGMMAEYAYLYGDLEMMEVLQYIPRLSLPPLAVTFISIVISLVSAVLGTGYILYTMNVRKGLETPYATLFDGFLFAGKVILLQIVMGIFIFLWSMLLIIPGIVAGYRYRFALYNLCENPKIGVMEAINMSKAQTRGHKWELFVLDLSFIGWSILCSLTLGILSIWIMPYMQQTDIGYFEAIKRMSGIGSHAPEDDGQFHSDDRFDGGPASYDPER